MHKATRTEPERPEKPHHRHLPRLPGEYYRGHAFVDWHMATVRRETGWLSTDFHLRFREVLLHALCRYHLVCPAYCLMPDHMHFLWFGVSTRADQRLAMSFLRRHTAPLLLPVGLQKQPYDHVLRDGEVERGALEAKAHYILENPVRKGTVSSLEAYEFFGCVVPGYPELQVDLADFGDRFWRIYEALCARHA